MSQCVWPTSIMFLSLGTLCCGPTWAPSIKGEANVCTITLHWATHSYLNVISRLPGSLAYSITPVVVSSWSQSGCHIYYLLYQEKLRNSGHSINQSSRGYCSVVSVGIAFWVVTIAVRLCNNYRGTHHRICLQTVSLVNHRSYTGSLNW